MERFAEILNNFHPLSLQKSSILDDRLGFEYVSRAQNMQNNGEVHVEEVLHKATESHQVVTLVSFGFSCF